MRAVKLYIKYNYSVADTSRELGYPSRNGLVRWYNEYVENGDLHTSFEKKLRYTREQMQKSVNYYLEHGRSIRRTVRILGYPSRTLLAQWIAELAPGDRKARITHGAMVQFSQEQKRMRLFPYVREIPLLRKLHKNMASGRKKRRYNSYMGEISPAVPNLLEPDFHADKPNKKWVTDITEFDIPAGSMSKKGCTPDNAACEGFFGTPKTEMFYGISWEGVSIEEFIQELDNFIRWYNEKRIKIRLGGMSPIDYRRSLSLVA